MVSFVAERQASTPVKPHIKHIKSNTANSPPASRTKRDIRKDAPLSFYAIVEKTAFSSAAPDFSQNEAFRNPVLAELTVHLASGRK